MTIPNPISLSTAPSLLAASLVLLIGALMTRKIGVLERYSIPGPIVGGLVFALALSAIALLNLPVMGAVAPIGGLLMIAAWLLIALAALRTQITPA